ncbi:Ubiquitin-40S ribosomal protein S27a [Taenia solium]|eukprot:TsM_000489200 transcript=TsM_000489200 gene=TsM_000489200
MVQLFLRRVNGSTLSFCCDEEKSIFDVKRHIELLEGIPHSLQSLSLNGSLLRDCDTLKDCCDSGFAQVDLNVDLLGGAKKRKKKVYTTPKKIKRKPKKVKLATLKFYQVEPNGKLNRLRRECPNKECGAGVFMASHFDREYCGKCGLTYRHGAQ